MKPKIILMTIILGLVCVVALVAIEGTFTWDPNTESDLAGYRLYMSDVSGEYVFGEGNEIAWSPAGIEDLVYDIPVGTWYFVLTAYDDARNESGPSNEVSVTINLPEPPPDTTPPQNPNGLQCFVGVSGG